MMSDNNSDLGAFLAGFIIGGLVGAATAIILAPQSGQTTREQLASKSRELRQAGGERVEQYRETVETYAGDYRHRADDLVAGTRGRVQEASGRVQEQARIVLDSGKERAGHIREQVNTYIQQDKGETNGSTETNEATKGDSAATA